MPPGAPNPPPVVVLDHTTLEDNDNDDYENDQAPERRRLQTLRHKLLVLEYKEHVGRESLDLVERLFHDLLATSESYERLQHREDRLSHDLALAQVWKEGIGQVRVMDLDHLCHHSIGKRKEERIWQ